MNDFVIQKMQRFTSDARNIFVSLIEVTKENIMIIFVINSRSQNRRVDFRVTTVKTNNSQHLMNKKTLR